LSLSVTFVGGKQTPEPFRFFCNNRLQVDAAAPDTEAANQEE
jgi:hypothetical protein